MWPVVSDLMRSNSNPWQGTDLQECAGVVQQPPKSASDPFILTTQPLDEVIAHYHVWARVMKGCALGCSIVGVTLMGSMLAWEAHKWWRKRRRRQGPCSLHALDCHELGLNGKRLHDKLR